jgi:acetolactate synthase-1/2/3 large subunit
VSDAPRAPTVGEVLAAFLEGAGVTVAFGVLSVHNMPLLDAVARRGTLRYVCARGEAGTVNMADAYARTAGVPGVAFTSTGAGAGNAAGALLEALTAGTPLLHVTGQVETAYVDRGWGDVHEAKDQLTMLGAVGKGAWRVRSADTALATFREAWRVACTPPCGPVSVEVPIDLQGAVLSSVPEPAALRPLPVEPPRPDAATLDALAERLAAARRPMLWAGGGARHAGAAIARLMALGVGLVTSIQGRGAVDEHDPRTLGAFNLQPGVERLYRSCDAMLVAGSRLRVPETARHALALPRPLYRIDADPLADGRGYPSALFVHGDAALALDGLADRLEGRVRFDPSLHAEIADTRARAEARMRETLLGRWSALVDALHAAAPDCNWVRDVTISNGTWGSRLFRVAGPRRVAHAAGGGIGQGLSMGIGAALGAPQRPTLALVGDGGLMLNAAELPTAVQEACGLVLLVMNDRGYGILRNLADAQFDGRRIYSDLHTPDFELLARAHGWRFHRVSTLADVEARLRAIVADPGPATMVEFDMDAIGPFAQPFSGPKI